MRCILALAALALTPPVHAQRDSTALTGYEVLAAFDDARRLAIDARDRLYVVDKGRESVLQLDLDGREVARLGGPGGSDGEFDEPLDIDPGIGLTWLVADAGNARLQRFSQSFLHLETLAVPREARLEPGTPGRLEPRDDQIEGGRPLAVAQSPTGEVFAIEGAQGLVLKWDKSRRLERTIGGFGQGALVAPVALDVDTDQLYVADRGLRAIALYDLFGGYIQTIARGQAEDASAVTLDGDKLWLILPSRILVMETTGRYLYTLQVKDGLHLVDAAPHGSAVYLLTRTALIRARTSPK